MGKSSSQVVGYRYYAKFAAFIGNRIEKLIAINFDSRGWQIGKTVRASQGADYMYIKKPGLYGENEGGVSGIVTIKTGEPNQTVACELVGRNGDLASAYPYQSYLTFSADLESLFGGINPELMLEEDLLDLTNLYDGSAGAQIGFYLGNSGYMKEMLLWVKRTRIRNDGRGQWYEVRGDGAVVCEIGSRKTIRGESEFYGFTATVKTKTTRLGGNSSESTVNATYTENQPGSLIVISRGVGSTRSGDAHLLENREVSFLSLDFPGDFYFEFELHVDSIAKSLTYDLSGAFITKIETLYNDYDIKVILIKGFTNSVDMKIVSDGMGYSPEGNETLPYANSLGVDLIIKKPVSAFDVINHENPDINPIHKIREILTDDTAMGKSESDVNDANFIKAANRIWDEGLGVSWAIDEKSCIEAIEELCYHIEAGIRVNRQTGLYEMVLFRDDWFAEDEIHNIAESKIKDLSLEVMNSDDIVNQLNVTYYDRERIKNSTFSVYENGSILTIGKANAESIDFPYFMNMRNAEIVANWKLKQFSTPAWSGSFTTGWKEARKWNRYDLIRLPWSKKWDGTILVRIMKINLGNGTDNTVTIDFEEVIPYSGEMNTSIVVDTPVDAGPQPPQPNINSVFEAPYYLTVLRAGQTNADLELSNNPEIGYVAAIAAKPQNNSLNALLYTDGGTGEFEQVSRLDYCDILQLDQSITETTSAFVVTGSLTQTANSNNLILLNDELMGFVSFDGETKVLTVKRGVLDTIPKKHNSGSLFVFDLPDVAFDSTQYAQSEIVEAQVLTTTPSGIQDSATSVRVEIQSRAIRPYPPANVKINGEYWPYLVRGNINLTWSHRNRLQQTGGEILGWFDADVTAETGVSYIINLYNPANELLVTKTTELNSIIIDQDEFTAINVRLEIISIRDNYECYQKFVYEFAVESAVNQLKFTTPYTRPIGNNIVLKFEEK